LVRFQPDGAIAVVTGASSGIGRELCRLLFQAGTSVVATARREDRLIRLGEELSTTSSCAKGAAATYRHVAGDVTDPAVREKVLRVAAELGQGRLDLLVNNAGIGALGPFESASEERLRRIMEVNFFAPAELVRAALPMLRRGRAAVICNIGSVLGHRGVPDKSEYCASKFALHGWSDSLRAELHPSGIAVTLVSPSTTSSEFFDAVIDTDTGAVSSSIGSWKPDRVARATFAAILSRRAEVILSLGGKTLVYADRIAPPLVNWVVAKRGAPLKP